MSSILDRIRNDANDAGVKIQSPENAKLEGILNKMFYLDKNIELETKFVHDVMTRGLESQERKGLHASAIIDKGDDSFCIRQQVLSLLYKQLQGEQLPVGTMRIFEEGNAVHEKWQRLFIRAGYAKPNTLDRTRFDDEFQLGFTPDIVCRIPEFYDGAMVGEIKSMNSFAFGKQDEHPSGKKQLYLYMYELIKQAELKGKWNGKDYLKGFVLMDSKNNQDFRVCVYDYNYEMVKPYVERLEQITKERERFVKTGKLSARHLDCTSYTCDKADKCPMKDACFGKGMGRVEI